MRSPWWPSRSSPRGSPAAAWRTRTARATSASPASNSSTSRPPSTSFREALAIEPSLGTARVNLAIALLYSGQLDAARTAAEAAAAALPDAPQPPYILGLIAKAQDRPDDAIAAFRRVLRVDPSDAATKVYLAQMYLQQRDAAQAVTLFKEALAAEPYNVTAAYGLAHRAPARRTNR